jgi:hypothetical protein
MNQSEAFKASPRKITSCLSGARTSTTTGARPSTATVRERCSRLLHPAPLPDGRGAGPRRSGSERKELRWLNKSAAGGLSVVALLAVVTLGCGTDETFVYSTTTGGSGGGGGRGAGGGGDGGGGGGGGAGGSSDVDRCPGQCVPLGPAVWQGPTLLWRGNPDQAPECPLSAPVEDGSLFDNLTAPNVCGACKCNAPTGSCALPTMATAAASSCAGDGPGVPQTSFNAPVGWDGTCTTASAIPANQKCNGVNCVQSLTIAALTVTEAPCGVSVDPVASKQPYTWGTVARTCRGAALGACGGPAEVCAPPAPPGFAQCLVQYGDRECPDSYPDKHVFYYSVEDTRACTPCACSAPVGSNCTSLVSVHNDSTCSTQVVASTVDATGPKCLDVLSGVALGSKVATTPVYTPGACEVSGGEPIGAAVPAEPSTFCCLLPAK